jgi:hypothetical protein
MRGLSALQIFGSLRLCGSVRLSWVDRGVRVARLDSPSPQPKRRARGPTLDCRYWRADPLDLFLLIASETVLGEA